MNKYDHTNSRKRFPHALLDEAVTVHTVDEEYPSHLTAKSSLKANNVHKLLLKFIKANL